MIKSLGWRNFKSTDKKMIFHSTRQNYLNRMTLNISISNHKVFFTIYPVEGEWEYFFAHFQKGVKSFKKGLRIKFGYLEGQFIDFMEDSGG